MCSSFSWAKSWELRYEPPCGCAGLCLSPVGNVEKSLLKPKRLSLSPLSSRMHTCALPRVCTRAAHAHASPCLISSCLCLRVRSFANSFPSPYPCSSPCLHGPMVLSHVSPFVLACNAHPTRATHPSRLCAHTLATDASTTRGKYAKCAMWRGSYWSAMRAPRCTTFSAFRWKTCQTGSGSVPRMWLVSVCLLLPASPLFPNILLSAFASPIWRKCAKCVMWRGSY